jgi:hypothetical protein
MAEPLVPLLELPFFAADRRGAVSWRGELVSESQPVRSLR